MKRYLLTNTIQIPMHLHRNLNQKGKKTMYKIQANEGRSGFSCYFSVGENRFYADITDFPFGQPECMIFSVGKRGKINWSGVYQNRNVKVSKRALKACIKEFQESKEGV